MRTPTILYLNNHYCNSLEDLQAVFQQDNMERVQLDILASYRDGVITSWLSEGDERSKGIAEQLKKIDPLKLGNSELLKLIANVINTGPGSDYVITYKIEEYADFLGCIWEGGANRPETRISANGSIVITEEEVLSLSIKYQFKIINPETESLNLHFYIKDNSDQLYEETKPLRLNVSRNSVQEICFFVSPEVFKRGKYDVVLKSNETVISRIYLVYKMDINLHFGDNTVNMVYVKGNGRISNFYMSDTPIVDSEDKPRTYLSYRDICKLLADWTKEYDILFKLPTVKQWMYAAKGGVNQDNYKYSGSDDADEVAWHMGNAYSGNGSRMRWYASREKQKVRQKKPNSIGLYDMSGNVWEMSEDKVESNPNKRYILGGSYNDASEALELSICKDYIGCTNEARENVGFRVVYAASDLIKLIENHPEYFKSPTTSRTQQ